jgi:hypothetical protein
MVFVDAQIRAVLAHANGSSSSRRGATTRTISSIPSIALSDEGQPNIMRPPLEYRLAPAAAATATAVLASTGHHARHHDSVSESDVALSIATSTMVPNAGQSPSSWSQQRIPSCRICLEVVGLPQITLPCHHHYHIACITLVGTSLSRTPLKTVVVAHASNVNIP